MSPSMWAYVIMGMHMAERVELRMVKVIDVFAGPGGLSEGFSAVREEHGRNFFDIAISIEKDKYAFETLKLRSFLRQFVGDYPPEYYEFLKSNYTLSELYTLYPEEAELASMKCWNTTLGPDGVKVIDVREKIDEAIKDASDLVLIGGPPCQAYSLVGRSRNHRNPRYDPNKDVRQRLYVDYLQILSDYRPIIFVMENVKGLLSATLNSENMFARIIEDLEDPVNALIREGRDTTNGGTLGYNIFSLTTGKLLNERTRKDAIIKSELYGVPQSRHRVILIGVRNDLGVQEVPHLKKQGTVNLSSVISDLPRLRSGISDIPDTEKNWIDLISKMGRLIKYWKGCNKLDDPNVLCHFMKSMLSELEVPVGGRGSEYIPHRNCTIYKPEWFNDPNLSGVCNHTTRTHLGGDLLRYFYVSCFGKVFRRSPNLIDFPIELLPNHSNVSRAIESKSTFSDRFRVQLIDKPCTTIVSHISKDGHYYIHPDPKQCRSFTVREAARVQTFPDNYFFVGPRTAQYVQVGNAVPPLLAYQIGEIVMQLLRDTET